MTVKQLETEYLQKLRGRVISRAFGLLLSDKHLYQSVTIDFTAWMVAELSKEQTSASREKAIQELNAGMAFMGDVWRAANVLCRINPIDKTSKFAVLEADQEFALPTVRTVCNNCEAVGPFNPVHAVIEYDDHDKATFLLPYECQSCKNLTIRFLVRRSASKLTLNGREPFEIVDVPAVIPKLHREHFRNAIIARNAGQTLSAIFQLRVFIEQFWRSRPLVAKATAKKQRPSGDELGQAYAAELPRDFRKRFPNLGSIYDSLSEAIHTAAADEKLVEDCLDQVTKHFQARDLFAL